MKSFMNIALAALLAGLVPGSADSAHPIEKVVKLIADLKAKVVADGKAEQASFDKYTCWCEKTLQRKASDISASKELVAETQILIDKLKGEIASHGAEISQLNKDIAKNIASQKDATAMRDKDHNEYSTERSESEQCIGAMEAAIKTLTGAGTKKGFLDTSTHEAQLLSVAAQVRGVFQIRSMPRSVSEQDIDLMKSFVAKPESFMVAAQVGQKAEDSSHLPGFLKEMEDREKDLDLVKSSAAKSESYMGGHHRTLSAAQVGQNPFGDYAPQSTQIQGILKGMYDAFTGDLEKDNAQEAESQKSFEELLATKKQEHATLEATLEKHETDHAGKTKRLKESEVLQDDTADQLAADEAFFADSKVACQDKAKEWSVRTRLRTEELAGMNQAMQILSSDDAKKTFKSSAETFLQVKSVSSGASKAYKNLRKLATKFRSLELAKIAALVQMGGHFDKVMVMIDEMVAILRKEEAEDVVHRDFCENSQNANKNEMADLNYRIKKIDEMTKRLGNTKKELDGEIGSIESDIGATKKSQAELLDFRNKEVAEFRQALKDDTDAVALIKQAIGALSKFYTNNKVSLELAQKAPEYAKDADKAPETWSGGGDYGGQKSQSTGILAILSMLAEDLEKEIADGRADDADAQEKYAKQDGALQNSLDAQEETKVSLEEELASTEEKIDAAEQLKKGKSDDKSAEGDTEKALATDCAWVKTHFQTRRDKRKDEMQGLVDAKAFLAGVESGDEPLPLA